MFTFAFDCLSKATRTNQISLLSSGVTTSSKQKKGRESEENGIVAARNNGGSDLEEATYDQQFAMQRCYNKEEHRDISLSSDSEVNIHYFCLPTAELATRPF